jgi:hypothetical protein
MLDAAAPRKGTHAPVVSMMPMCGDSEELIARLTEHVEPAPASEGYEVVAIRAAERLAEYATVVF